MTTSATRSIRITARRCAVLLVAVPALAACRGTAGGSSASCVGPWLDDRPAGRFLTPAATPTVAPGSTLTVHGHWYTTTCNDTNIAHEPLEPLPPVRLTMRLPGGTVSALGSFSPGGPDMGFTVPIHLPATASAGSALVSDDRGTTYRFDVAPG